MATSWLSRVASAFLGNTEARTSLENPQVPLSYPAEWLLDIFNGGRTDSGMRVSEMTALQVVEIFGCVNLISDGISSLPLNVYKRSTEGKRVRKTLAVDHAVTSVLADEPNPEMTAPTFFKTLMLHALLWGNAYAEIERDASGSVKNLWPRNPARTKPIRLLTAMTFHGDLLPAGTMMYETSDGIMDSSTMTVAENPDTQNVGRRRVIHAEDMLHVPGLSLDGRLGQDVVWLTRQTIGLALATEKYGAKFFGNGARPAGILTMPSKLEDKALENLRRSWAEAHGGENQFKVAVLEQGVKFEKIAATPEEGQMLETRKFVRETICAIFGVPTHMISASDKSGKSNVEQSSIEFVQFCLHPWLVRWEKEIGRKCFPKMGRTAGMYFPKFDTRKLMYPDAESRAKFYTAGKQWGFLCTNDIRELEDMNPLDDASVGERFWQPTNVEDASKSLGPADKIQAKLAADKDLASHAAALKVEVPGPGLQEPEPAGPGGANNGEGL
jgi:HK97 family phage portal protein